MQSRLWWTGHSCLETYFFIRVHRGGKSCLKTPLWCLIWRRTRSLSVDSEIARREPTWNDNSRNKIPQSLFYRQSISKYCKFWLCPITLQKLKRADVLERLSSTMTPLYHRMTRCPPQAAWSVLLMAGPGERAEALAGLRKLFAS